MEISRQDRLEVFRLNCHDIGHTQCLKTHRAGLEDGETFCVSVKDEMILQRFEGVVDEVETEQRISISPYLG